MSADLLAYSALPVEMQSLAIPKSLTQKFAVAPHSNGLIVPCGTVRNYHPVRREPSLNPQRNRSTGRIALTE
jgi:hypothetical protein